MRKSKETLQSWRASYIHKLIISPLPSVFCHLGHCFDLLYISLFFSRIIHALVYRKSCPTQAPSENSSCSLFSKSAAGNVNSYLNIHIYTHQRRTWQPTPVFLPGESQGWRSLVDCHLWGHTESDTTEETAAATAYTHIRCSSEYLLGKNVCFLISFLTIINLVLKKKSSNNTSQLYSYIIEILLK